jgi:uncharacterized protein YutE (UPF0331/DUF86 family)
LIDAAVDINLPLLRMHGFSEPLDHFGSFVALGRQGILPDILAARISPAAGLRNRRVRENDRVDDGIVLNAVRTARVEFAEHVAATEAHAGGGAPEGTDS